MKRTTLEDLDYGNINPNEISFVRGSEYVAKTLNENFYVIYNTVC